MKATLCASLVLLALVPAAGAALTDAVSLPPDAIDYEAEALDGIDPNPCHHPAVSCTPLLRAAVDYALGVDPDSLPPVPGLVCHALYPPEPGLTCTLINTNCTQDYSEQDLGIVYLQRPNGCTFVLRVRPAAVCPFVADTLEGAEDRAETLFAGSPGGVEADGEAIDTAEEFVESVGRLVSDVGPHTIIDYQGPGCLG